MKFEGTVEIHAPRQQVWDFLIDPEQIGSCGPGVQSIETVDDSHFKVHAKVGVGFISARFVVNAEFVELDAPTHAVISARGTAPGSAVDATARMALRDSDPDGEHPATIMDWTADVNIAGTLASVGARMIEGTATKIIDQTFDCIRAKLEA